MTLEQLEAEVLALPKHSQALLVARLVEHLGQTSEIEPEVAQIWAEEATERDKQMDHGQLAGIGSIHFWKKHKCLAPKTGLYAWSKKVDLPKLDAPRVFLLKKCLKEFVHHYNDNSFI